MLALQMMVKWLLLLLLLLQQQQLARQGRGALGQLQRRWPHCRWLL
jgi:hypothetical protein